MIREIEALTADAVVGEAAHTPAHPSHTCAACLNCGAGLHGRYCHVCGQTADDHHRSILHLAWEAVEGFTHLDGRLAQTLPALLIRPGHLARDQIEGRRQRHVPPFRLFLITLLVFMFSAEAGLKSVSRNPPPAGTETGRLPPAAVAPAGTPNGAARTYKVGQDKVVVVTGMSGLKSELDHDPTTEPFGRWLRDHLGRALQNPEYFKLLVFEWAHRAAVLMLPILAALLTLCYVRARQFYVYNHLVVAMQYLSFSFLVWAPIWIAPKGLSDWLFPVALVWTPFNLYLILRTAYGSGRIAATVKAVTVWASTALIFSLLLAGLLVFVLDQM